MGSICSASVQVSLLDWNLNWDYIPIMETQVKNALFSAVIRVIRSLVRIFLRNGLPFGEFAELARWVYVDVAYKEFGIEGRKQTDSRVSIITGLSRKEVRRLRTMAQPVNKIATDRYNRAARVIAGWRRDKKFHDQRGRPCVLPIETGSPSFNDLVKIYSGDVPARAILDELVQVKAVERTPDNRIRLVSKAYLPKGDPVKMHNILGMDVSLLVDTIDHNTRSDNNNHWIQRKVSYDNLPVEALPEIRKLSENEGQRLLEKLDRKISVHDRDINSTINGTGRKFAGLGLYYFEKDAHDILPDEEGEGR
jgi:hypothetical protein